MSYWPGCISVLDLGCTSSADCKLIASVRVGAKYGVVDDSFQVQAISDGMGLIFYLSCV